jgi:hypothetical protein
MISKKTQGCFHLELSALTKLDLRWQHFLASNEHDHEFISALSFLQTKYSTTLIRFVRRYGSQQLKVKLCTSLLGQVSVAPLVVPSDFMVYTLPTTTHCTADFKSTCYSVALPTDVLYKIFLLVAREDYIFALTALKLVCKLWNSTFYMSDIEHIKDLMSASQDAALQFLNDALVQIARKKENIDLFRPWKVSTREKVRDLIVFIFEAHKFNISIHNLAKNQSEVLGTNTKHTNAVYSILLRFYAHYYAKIWQDIMSDFKFRDYDQLDRFARCSAKWTRRYVPIIGSDWVWPKPEALLAEAALFRNLEMSLNDKLDYFDRVVMKKCDREEAHRLFVELFLQHSSVYRVLQRAFIRFNFYSSISRDTIEFLVNNVDSSLSHYIGNKDLVLKYLEPVDVDCAINSTTILQEIEYIIDAVLNGNGAVDPQSTNACEFCLNYMCCHKKYNVSHWRKFVEHCVSRNIDFDSIKRIIFLAVTGSNDTM